jgi:hypothetical protein
MVPSYPLDYTFLDESFDQLHAAEQRMSEMFSVFAVLAIAVACLGLFGLAAYTAEQRTKEIGVRKVLGASAWSIYASLSREFLRWVVLANVIAWPLAYYAMSSWLRNFSARIGIGWGIFPLAAPIRSTPCATNDRTDRARTEGLAAVPSGDGHAALQAIEYGGHGFSSAPCLLLPREKRVARPGPPGLK